MHVDEFEKKERSAYKESLITIRNGEASAQSHEYPRTNTVTIPYIAIKTKRGRKVGRGATGE